MIFPYLSDYEQQVKLIVCPFDVISEPPYLDFQFSKRFFLKYFQADLLKSPKYEKMQDVTKDVRNLKDPDNSGVRLTKASAPGGGTLLTYNIGPLIVSNYISFLIPCILIV